MRASTRRAWASSLAGALLAAAAFLGCALAGQLFDPATLPVLWPGLLLIPLVSGAAIFTTVTLVTRSYRRSLGELAKHVAWLCDNPAPYTRDARSRNNDLVEELQPLRANLEALAARYRQVLADHVAQNEALEGLRLLVGRVEGEKNRGHSVIHRGSGSSRNMVARLTPNLHWMTATPALQQFLGCSLADLNARRFTDHVHPHDAPALARPFQEALETGEVHNITFRILCRPPGIKTQGSGVRSQESAELTPESSPLTPELTPAEERHVQLDVTTRYTEEGTPLHFRCYFIDITDRVRSEQELRQRTEELSRTNAHLRQINQDLERLKESYRDLYHNAPVMYFSLDEEARIVACNNNMLRVLGLTRDDLLHQSYLTLLAPESRKLFLQDANFYQQPGEIEARWVKKDGTIIDVAIRSVPVQDAEGHFVRSRSIAQDVTERNRLANELRRRKDELEHANEELRRINHELEEFNSVVSHDLKEPLRTLESFSTFLAQDCGRQLGPIGLEHITYLVQASRRLGLLIDELLNLSRVGRITRVPQVFDPAAAVNTVRGDLTDLIQRKGASVEVEGSLPLLFGDSTRITQLLANLVGNGLKYNTSAQPKVVIGSTGVEEPAVRERGSTGKELAPFGLCPSYAIFYVRDNGIGIDPRYHQQIFRLFRRLHRSEEYEGTGAGLAICKKIVEAHGGRIWVESQLGQGAAFYFTLPRPPATIMTRGPRAPLTRLQASGEPLEKSNGNGSSPDPTGPARDGQPPPLLLLVEDMTEISLIAQRLGQRAGYRVDRSASAEEAWEYLQQSRPDLVLLDVNLPGMSGIELCRRIRATPNLSRLAIALFSHGDRSEDHRAGVAAGADWVLSKELLCQPDAWQQRLRELLTRPQKDKETGGQGDRETTGQTHKD
jgi:PAS domain S-box-containing protein